jgi:GTPase Era involved in 16S rRNA processing
LNKVDRLDRSSRCSCPASRPSPGAATSRHWYRCRHCARKTSRQLERRSSQRLPEGPFLFEEDEITDRSARFLAAEIVREKITRQLGDELPYSATVEIEEFGEDGGVVHIAALILVEREGQKAYRHRHKGGSRLRQHRQRGAPGSRAAGRPEGDAAPVGEGARRLGRR